jgi:Tol biopolymer transport system component
MRLSFRAGIASLAVALAVAALVAPAALAKPNEIAYTCDLDVCLVDPDNPAAIVNLTANGDKTYDEEPIWSPTGDRVAFVSSEPGKNNQNLFVMQPDAPGQTINLATQLTHYADSASVYNLVWSPDGTRLAYERSQGGYRQIFAVAADGSTLTPLSIASPGEHPSWSPDGGKIAFSQGTDQVYTTNADGSNAIAPVLDAKGRYPVWGPGGTKIAFEPLIPAGFQSRNVNIGNYIGGGAPVVLTANQPDGAFPRWSPDGARIAYRAREAGERDVIHVANANGSGDIPLPGLTGVRIYNAPMTWAPDGSRVAFEGYNGTNNPGTFAVYVANTNGSGGMIAITADARNLEPSWRPDPLRTPFVPVITPSGGSAGQPPGGRKPKVVWFTKRAPITGGGPIHVMIVFCGAPDCGASSVGKVPSASVPAGLRFRPASASKKKKPKALVVGAGKLSLAQGQEKTLDMYLNKAGRALLKKRGKLDIKTTVTITSAGQPPVTETRTIPIALAKPKPKKKR